MKFELEEETIEYAFQTVFNFLQPLVRTRILCKHQLTKLQAPTCQENEDTIPQYVPTYNCLLFQRPYLGLKTVPKEGLLPGSLYPNQSRT